MAVEFGSDHGLYADGGGSSLNLANLDFGSSVDTPLDFGFSLWYYQTAYTVPQAWVWHYSVGGVAVGWRFTSNASGAGVFKMQDTKFSTGNGYFAAGAAVFHHFAVSCVRDTSLIMYKNRSATTFTVDSTGDIASSTDDVSDARNVNLYVGCAPKNTSSTTYWLHWKGMFKDLGIWRNYAPTANDVANIDLQGAAASKGRSLRVFQGVDDLADPTGLVGWWPLTEKGDKSHPSQSVANGDLGVAAHDMCTREPLILVPTLSVPTFEARVDNGLLRC